MPSTTSGSCESLRDSSAPTIGTDSSKLPAAAGGNDKLVVSSTAKLEGSA
jgi:hypothetical protein